MIGLEIDSVVLAASIGSGIFGMALGAYMLRRARISSPARSVNEIVQTAPYNRLHNVIRVDRRG